MAERPLGVSIVCVLQFISAAVIGVLGVIFFLWLTGVIFAIPEVYFYGIGVPILGMGTVIVVFFLYVIGYGIFGVYPPFVVLLAFFLGLGVGMTIFGVLGFSAAYGLWKLERKAFRLALSLNIILIAIFVLYGISSAVFVVYGTFLTGPLLYTGIIIPVIIVIYLISSRKQFI
jgi:hypothetical protein